MNDLIVKDVDFNGAILRAAKDQNNVIWAGVRWICDGIGMTEGQRKRQIANIQTDIVLSKGGSNLNLPTSGGKQEVLCLQLDYVPLWLAKISITPNMQKENPQLVENLVTYQLKAKDVLAAAFLRKKPNVEERLEKIERLVQEKFDSLNDDLAKALEVIFRSQGITSLSTGANLIASDNNLPINMTTDKDYTSWKLHVYELSKEIMKYDYRYSQSKSVLSAAYYRMRDTYGFVQAQSEKEYRYRHGVVDEKIPTIDIIYDDRQYRTVLVPVLQNMLEEAKQMTPEKRMDNMIEPLVQKCQDKSPHHCAVYRKIFKQMEEENLVCWKNRITRYQREHCTKKVPSKKLIISENSKLMKYFEQTVRKMADEG